MVWCGIVEGRRECVLSAWGIVEVSRRGEGSTQERLDLMGRFPRDNSYRGAWALTDGRSCTHASLGHYLETDAEHDQHWLSRLQHPTGDGIPVPRRRDTLVRRGGR
jgi:hypothetical protein